MASRSSSTSSARVVPLRVVCPVRELPLPFDDAATLVAALLEGSTRAQAFLWDRHSVVVRAVLRRTLGPQGDVEDAVQEVFIRFFRSLPGLREASALRSFLVGIAVRVARNELRKRRLKRWFFLTDDGHVPEPDAASASPDAHSAREAVRRLYVILDDLDDESRLAFVLRHIEGLEISDVAASLSLSLATVKRRLARVTPLVFARARADAALAPYMDLRPAGADDEAPEQQVALLVKEARS